MRRTLPAAVALVVLAGSTLAACQSTQSKSAELAQQNAGKLLNEEGLAIKKESSIVTVVKSAVVTDADRAAVAVLLNNESARVLANVPIGIDLRDAKGKSVFKNDTPGLDPTLTSMPVLQPGQEAWWVNDQILATGTPKTVRVTVGDTEDSYPGELPQITVGDATLKNDPVSGLEATGTIENMSSEELFNTYVYAVATQGDQVVAAGRGAIEKMKPNAPKPPEYHIFMVGDPTGADITVEDAPTAPGTTSLGTEAGATTTSAG